MFASDAAARSFRFARGRSFASYQDSLAHAIVLFVVRPVPRSPLGPKTYGKALEADLVVPVPAAQGSAVRARIQPGGFAVRTIGQAAQAPASEHFISEKAA